MKYMGSKNRISKYIVPIMLNKAEERNIITWVEPFVGGANMIDKVPINFKRIGYDINDHTIHALIDIRDNIDKLPNSFSETERKESINNKAESIKSWGCIITSFGADLNGGYSRGKKNNGVYRDFVGEGKRNAIKQSPLIQDVEFICDSYENLDFDNCLIYCDPPYRYRKRYRNKFNHDKFYDWCREQSKKNVLFVSEYDMPSDFICVWEMEVKTYVNANASVKATEKLFTL